MKYNLQVEELDKIVSKTDFSDLNTHLGGCRSVAVGIGQVVENEGIVAPLDEEESIIHAFVKVNGALFDADGLAYKDSSNIVRMVHEYNPFESECYKPKHFPMRSLMDDEIDDFLLREYVVEYKDESEAPNNDELSSEVAERIRTTVENQNRNS